MDVRARRRQDDVAIGWIATECAVVLVVPVLGLPVHAAIPLVLLASVSLWLRGRGWAEVGLSAGPDSGRHAFLGVVLGVSVLLFDVWVGGPLVHGLTGRSVEFNHMTPVRGNATLLATTLVLAWAGAFAVEMVFRGFLVSRLQALPGDPQVIAAASVVTAALAYGWFSAWQLPGDAGGMHMIGGWLMGVGFGVLYLATGRNLVLPIAFHGALQSTHLVLVYLQRV